MGVSARVSVYFMFLLNGTTARSAIKANLCNASVKQPCARLFLALGCLLRNLAYWLAD